MKKKITMKDIAKQAGVSVATVSYVINNRTDQRISEETRKKILQIVNLLDYTPNSAAKSLATNRTFLIVLYMASEISLLKRSEQLLVVEVLAQVLQKYGYNLVFKNNNDIDRSSQADAILCYDVNTDYFHQIGDKNLIPLLGIDTLIDIPWFFQVCSDYNKIKVIADNHFGVNNYTFLALSPNNIALKSHIENTFLNTIFANDFNDLENLSPNVVYHQNALNTYIKKPGNSLYLETNYYKKMEKICECIDFAIHRIPDLEHQYFI